MCTLIAERQPTGWRVSMNRDEAIYRPTEEPPFYWADADMLAPRDPQGGGTWIGVRRDGAWAALLNGYLPERPDRPIAEPQTRGRLIPLVLHAGQPLDALQTEDLSRTHSFRMWLGEGDQLTDIFWDGETLALTAVEAAPHAFVTSSSFDQERVKSLRADVFESWRKQGAEALGNGLPRILADTGGLDDQDAIAMARPWSHTKSSTQFITEGREIRMLHWFFDERFGPAGCEITFPPEGSAP